MRDTTREVLTQEVAAIRRQQSARATEAERLSENASTELAKAMELRDLAEDLERFLEMPEEGAEVTNAAAEEPTECGALWDSSRRGWVAVCDQLGEHNVHQGRCVGSTVGRWAWTA